MSPRDRQRTRGRVGRPAAKARTRPRRRGGLRRLQPAPVLPRRQHVLHPAAGRRLPPARRRHRRRGRGSRRARRPDHSARRRHQPGRPDRRRRPGARHLPPPRPDPRARPGVTHRRRRRRRRAGPAQPGRGTARAAVRPGHLDQQPGHHRRHDRQQLGRQRQPALRHDHRPRARARRRALRRVDRAPRAGRRGRARATRAGGHARGAALRRPAGHHGQARPLDRRGLPGVLAAGLRLPTRPARRRHPLRPREVRGRLRRDPRGDHARRGRPGPQAEARGLRRRALHVDPLGDRRHGRCPVHGPGPGRADGQDDPRPVPEQDRVRRPRQDPRGRPARRCCSCPSPATTSTS